MGKSDRKSLSLFLSLSLRGIAIPRPSAAATAHFKNHHPRTPVSVFIFARSILFSLSLSLSFFPRFSLPRRVSIYMNDDFIRRIDETRTKGWEVKEQEEGGGGRTLNYSLIRR